MSTIKTIIFDLDNTLFDTDKQCVDKALKEAIRAMIEAGMQAEEKVAFKKIKQIIKEHPVKERFNLLAKHYKAPIEIARVGKEVYYSTDIKDISLFDGVKTLLKKLRADYQLALITFGNPIRQERKLELLGLRKYFDNILITQEEDKETAFLELIDDLGIKQNRILVVGDRIDSELAIGNKLGMKTVRVLHGKYKLLTPKSILQEPDYTIKTVKELSVVLNKIKTAEDKLLQGPRIALIGAGTGIPALLEGLKKYTKNLASIVNIIDEGRSSGVLRKELGMPPPGDIRNNIIALADSEKLLADLFQYRFEKGSLEGHSFGNLFLAALTQVTGNFQTAIKEMSKILNLKGGVYPASLEDVKICVELEDGKHLRGEQEIVVKGDRIRTIKRAPIKRAYLDPKYPSTNPAAIEAILNAQAIIIGPGTHFSSIMPNLLLPGIKDALKKTKAKVIYVCNIMTQPGQTEGFTASDHLKHIINAVEKGVIDYIIMNDEVPPKELLAQYEKDNSFIVENDIAAIKKMGVKPITENLVEDITERKVLWSKVSLLRHDSNKIAETIVKLIQNGR